MAESRQRRWQLERTAAGLCRHCGQLRRFRGGQRCKKCQETNAASNRKRTGYVKWHPGSPGRPPYDATPSQRAKARKIAYQKKAKPILARIAALNKKLQVLRKQEKRDG